MSTPRSPLLGARPHRSTPTAFRYGFERRRRADGLRVATARRPVPLISLRLVFHAGVHHDPADRRGLASLTAPLLRAGSSRRSARRIVDAAEALGGFVATGADWETGWLAIDVLPEDLETALELLFELAAEPTFPRDALESARRRRLRQLEQRVGQPAELATEWLARALYGATAYGTSLLGDHRGLTAIARDDLARFHRRFFTAHNGFLAAAGGIDRSALMRLLDRLPALPSGVRHAAPETRAAPGAVGELLVVDLPWAHQTELRLGHRGVAHGDPDLLALQVLNEILGGSAQSRLGERLRRALGLSYFVHSRFVVRSGAGPFLVSTSVDNDRVRDAVGAIRDELERLRDRPVPEAELRDASACLAGRLHASFESSHDLLDRLTHLEVHELPDDHFDRCLDEIRRPAPADLLTLARRALRPRELTLVAVGPAAELAPQLESLGALRVVRPDELETYVPEAAAQPGARALGDQDCRGAAGQTTARTKGGDLNGRRKGAAGPRDRSADLRSGQR